MKLHRTALATAVVLSSLAGGAYAGNYDKAGDPAQSHRSNPVSEQQQQQQHQSPPSSGTTSPSGTPDASTMPSTGDTAPANPSNVRDRQALDTNNDGVISADEQKRIHPGQSGAPGAAGTSTEGTGSDASGTQPYQGPATSDDKLRDGSTGNPTPGPMNRPDQMQRY